MKKVFIDGSAGTTGLRIFDRLHRRTDIQLLTLPESERKLESSRKRLLNEADVVFLCLPDDAAREAASWVENPDTVVLDTSTAHRTAPGWCYGFPELSPVQEARLRQAKRIAKACEDAGCAFFAPSPTNQQFPIFPDTALEKLAEKYKYSYWARVDETHSAVRLCTSWATTDENVDALCKDIASVMAE